VRLWCFVAPACTGATADHRPQAGPVAHRRLHAQRDQAQPVGVGQFGQMLHRGTARAIQAIQAWRGGELAFSRVHQTQARIIAGVPGAQLPAAPQALVEQRLARLDQPRLEQQRADLAGGALVADVARLPQQARLVWVAQVGQHAAAQVHALADVQRQALAVTMEDVHARCSGQRLRGRAQAREVDRRRVGGGVAAGNGFPRRRAPPVHASSRRRPPAS
jgi:hypothetical protein